VRRAIHTSTTVVADAHHCHVGVVKLGCQHVLSLQCRCRCKLSCLHTADDIRITIGNLGKLTSPVELLVACIAAIEMNESLCSCSEFTLPRVASCRPFVQPVVVCGVERQGLPDAGTARCCRANGCPMLFVTKLSTYVTAPSGVMGCRRPA